MQWNGLTDVTDACQVARQLAWAATAESARNEPFNVVPDIGGGSVQGILSLGATVFVALIPFLHSEKSAE
jgi:hypothetical protein